MRPLLLLLLMLAMPALAQDLPADPPAQAPAPPVTEPSQLQPVAEPAPAATEPLPQAGQAPPAAEPQPLSPGADPTAPPPPPAVAPAPAPAAPEAAAVAAPTPRLPRFGLRLGVGFPDAFTADLVFRPVPFLRFHAGPAWNYLAMGLQGGVAIQPFRWWVSPVLEANYGHFFHGDLTRLVKDNNSNSSKLDVKPLLRSFGYDYFSGQLSLEFGSPRGFAFSIGVGLTYFWSTLHGSATMTSASTNPADLFQSYRVTVANPTLRAVIPSARLGLLFYF
jgi:hypothetical protein